MRSSSLLVLLPGLLFALPARAAELPDLTEEVKGRTEPGPKDAALVVAIEEYPFAPNVPGAVSNGNNGGPDSTGAGIGLVGTDARITRTVIADNTGYELGGGIATSGGRLVLS